MEARADHYADQEDRYKNFEAACDISGRKDMTEVAAEFALKHLAFIYTAVMGHTATIEELTEAFCDAHNYCLICKDMLESEAFTVVEIGNVSAADENNRFTFTAPSGEEEE